MALQSKFWPRQALGALAGLKRAPDRPRLVPAMRYRDVNTALNWLCAAFGFEKHSVVSDEAGDVLSAQLLFGDAMILVLPVRDFELDRFMKQPDEIGGAETQSCYFVVDDADAHYAKARDAGAEIILDIKDFDADGRGYSCRDPEGHIWSFGTLDPWRAQSVAPTGRFAGFPRESVAPLAIGAVFVASLIGAAALGGAIWPASAPRDDAAIAKLEGRAAEERGLRETAERDAQTAREGLERERGAREVAEREARALRDAPPKPVNEAKEPTGPQTRKELVREREAKLKAEREAKDAREQLAAERTARETAERTAREAQGQLAVERSARAAAERESRKPASQNESAADNAAAPRPILKQAPEKAQKRAPPLPSLIP